MQKVKPDLSCRVLTGGCSGDEGEVSSAALESILTPVRDGLNLCCVVCVGL